MIQKQDKKREEEKKPQKNKVNCFWENNQNNQIEIKSFFVMKNIMNNINSKESSNKDVDDIVSFIIDILSPY